MAAGNSNKSRQKREHGQRAAAAHNFAEASKDAGEAGRRSAEQAGEAGRRGMEEASEAGRRSIEQLRGATERAGQAATDLYSRSARETTQGLEAAVKYSTVLASGMQTLWQEWIGCAQDAMQRNVDGLQNMMRSRSPSDFFAAQTEMLRDEVQVFIDSGSRLSEVSARIASDAARAFGEQFEGGEMGQGGQGGRGQGGGGRGGQGKQQQGRGGQGGQGGQSRT